MVYFVSFVHLFLFDGLITISYKKQFFLNYIFYMHFSFYPMSVWRCFLPFRKANLPSSSSFLPPKCSFFFGFVSPSSSSSTVPLFLSVRSFVHGPMSSDESALTAERVATVLRSKFGTTDGSTVHVDDTSGGCGAMFHVRVESPQFSGMTRVKQHKIINEVLRSEIRNMHGITIETKAMDKTGE